MNGAFISHGALKSLPILQTGNKRLYIDINTGNHLSQDMRVMLYDVFADVEGNNKGRKIVSIENVSNITVKT